MTRLITPDLHPLRRRDLLVLGLATTLGGCGGGGGGGQEDGGGGGSEDPVPGPGSAAPGGQLVYRNSGMAGVWNFASAQALSFDPGAKPLNDPGMAVSRSGVITAALAGDNQGFAFATFDLAGQRLGVWRVNRELAFQTGRVVFNDDGTRVAFSVDEPASASNDERISRTLVAAWPGGSTLASLDGFEDPAWAGSTGELLVMDTLSRRLRLFNAQLQDQGWLADLTLPPGVGAYTVSPDGRFVVISDLGRLDAYDRQTGERWLAATRISNLTCPCFSPDGRFLAAHAIDVLTANPPFFWNYMPHIVPFERNTTVTVDSVLHRLQGTLAETGGHMGWAP